MPTLIFISLLILSSHLICTSVSYPMTIFVGISHGYYSDFTTCGIFVLKVRLAAYLKDLV